MIIEFVKDAWFCGNRMKKGEKVNTICTACAERSIKSGEAKICKQEGRSKKSK